MKYHRLCDLESHSEDTEFDSNLVSSCLHRRKFSATASNGTSEEETLMKVGAWDFVDSTQRSNCNCSRYKHANSLSLILS